MLRDIGTAARSLRRRPLVALTAAASLGIGMALATSVFAMLERLVLRDPFAGSGAVFSIYMRPPHAAREEQLIPARYFLALEQDSRTLAGLAAAEDADAANVVIGSSGDAATLPTVSVTSNYFATVGVRPVIGRVFDDNDALRGAAPAVIIDYDLWQSRFGGSADVLSRPVVLNGREGRILGVMPKGFSYPMGARVWLPLGEQEIRAVAANAQVDFGRFLVQARLAPRATLAAAATEVQIIAERADVVAHAINSPRMQVLSVPAARRQDLGPQVELWMSLSFIILALCGVNFATVTLARGIRRRPELAVRTALGASRRQIAGMFVAEAALLGAASGIVAVVLSLWFSGLLRLNMPGVPTMTGLALDWRVVSFGVLATTFVGVVVALAPAIQLARADLRSHLAAGSVGGDRGAGGLTRDRAGLVALQLALAALCIASVAGLIRIDRRFDDLGPGYDFDHVISAHVLVQDSVARGFMEGPLLDFVRSRPGVQAASIERIRGAAEIGMDARSGRYSFPVWIDASTDLFSTLRVAPVAGRLPTDAESRAHAPVAVLSENAAHMWMFDSTSAVGKRIYVKAPGRPLAWLTVVGVVPAVRRGPDFQLVDGWKVYTNWGIPMDESHAMLFVRVRGSAARSVAALRRAFAGFDHRVVITDLRTVGSDVAQFTARAQSRRNFLSGIALLSFVLAAVGVYGLTGYTTAARAKEICIRLALGAGTVDVARIILGRLLALSVVGAALGVLLAQRFAEILDNLLRNPRQFFLPVPFPMLPAVLSAIVLLGIAFAGAYVPLRRVLRRDISQGLR